MSKQLKDTKPYSPVTWDSTPQISDEAVNAITKIEDVIDRIVNSDKVSDSDLALYEDYRTRVQYEMRKGRFVIFKRLYDLVNLMMDRLQDKIAMGEELDITPSQMRLYLSMFLDQTRSEFEDDGPETYIDQRTQVIKFIRVHTDKDSDNGRIIDA